MQRYRDTVLREGPAGLQPTRNASITVFNHGTDVLAVIYSTNGYAPKDNPFRANAQGAFDFYADNGRYDVLVSGNLVQVRLDDVLMEDVIDEVEAVQASIAVILDMEAKRSFVDLGSSAVGVSQSRSAIDNRINLQQTVDALATLERRGFMMAPPCSDGGWIDTDQPIYWRNNIGIEGGPGTRFRNTSAVEAFAGQGRWVDCGNYNPGDILTEPSYACGPIVSGSSVVPGMSAGDRAMFIPGDVVWIANLERAGSFATKFCANRVASISGGVINLERPLTEDIAEGARIYKSSGTQYVNVGGVLKPRRIVAGAQFKNFEVQTTAVRAWMWSAGGMYECEFDTLKMDVRAGVYTNASFYSKYLNLNTTFVDRAIELGVYSSDNLIQGFEAYWKYRNLTDPKTEPVIGVNENARRNKVLDYFIDSGDCEENAAISVAYGSGNLFDRGKMRVPKIKSDLVVFAAGPNHTQTDNLVSNTEFIDVNTDGYLVRYGANASAIENNNGVENLTFRGVQKRPEAVIFIRANNPYVRNLKSPLGGYAIQPATTNEVIDGIQATVGRHMTQTRSRSVAITAVANNGSGLIRVTAADHRLLNGSMTFISGVVGVPANGAWVVNVIDLDTVDLVASTFSGAYVSGGSLRWDASGRVSRLSDLSAVALKTAQAFAQPLASSSPTDTNNVIASIVIPPDTLVAGDLIAIRARVLFSGTAGTKTLQLRANGTAVATVTLTAAETGSTAIETDMLVATATGSKYFTGVSRKGSVFASIRNAPSINTQTLPLKLDVVAYVANTADSMSMDGVTFTPTRKGIY